MRAADTSVAQRLSLGFGIVFLLMLMLIGVNAYGQQRVDRLLGRLTDEIMPAADAAIHIQTAYLRQSASVRLYVDSGDDRYLSDYTKYVSLAQDALGRLDDLSKNTGETRLFDQIKALADRYDEEMGRAIFLRQQGASSAAQQVLDQEMAPTREQLLEEMESFADVQLRLRDEAKSEVDVALHNVAGVSYGLAFLAIVVGAAVAFFVSMSVSRPVQSLALASRSLAEGDFEPALRLEHKAGDWEEVQSSRNELRVLTATFGRTARELLKREKRLSARAQLSAVLASSIDAEKVACDALREIATYTKCEFGLIYVLDSELNVLRRIGAYCIASAPDDIKVGEGIAGEAAASRRRVLVQDIPSDTPFSVRFGFDQVPPKTIVAVPVICQDQLIGTVLMGSVRDLTDDALDFIEVSAQQLGVSLQDALVHRQVTALAEELQKKNELLASQNEEMQVQSEEIQSQSEQLAAQNEELEAQRKELIELDHLKDEFLSIASHELKSPLTSLKGFTQILQERMQLTPYYEEFQKPLAAIDGQVNKVVSLVNRLLDVSRVQMGRLEMKPELVHLGELARRQANRAQIKATEHKIVVDSDSEVVGYWDPGYIEQVVTNLVDNAVRYSPSGSEVRISLRQVNNTALLTVTDQGIGISSDALPNLFQRYYRSEEAKRICAEGMGIGLYVTYSIVNAHGGCIWVDSEPGKGSTFHVQLPVQPASFWKEAEESIYAKQESEEQHTGG